MSHLVFNLRNVPEDEIVEILQLLDEHQIEYYETSAGFWGISVAAIWVKEADVALIAKNVISQYQQNRYLQAHQNYQEQVLKGEHRRLADPFLESPVKYIAIILAVLAIIYISIFPYVSLIK